MARKFKENATILFFEKCAAKVQHAGDDVVNEWKMHLIGLLEGYKPCGIFNADEIVFFYKCIPGKTLAFKNETCSGGKDAESFGPVHHVSAKQAKAAQKLPRTFIERSINADLL